MMNPVQEYLALQTRRQFFGRAAMGLGTAALTSMASPSSAVPQRSPTGGLIDVPHFAPKAKRAIYLFLAGARHCTVPGAKCLDGRPRPPNTYTPRPPTPHRVAATSDACRRAPRPTRPGRKSHRVASVPG